MKGEWLPSSSIGSTPRRSRATRRDQAGEMARSSRQRMYALSPVGQADRGHGSRRGAAAWGRSRANTQATSSGGGSPGRRRRAPPPRPGPGRRRPGRSRGRDANAALGGRSSASAATWSARLRLNSGTSAHSKTSRRTGRRARPGERSTRPGSGRPAPGRSREVAPDRRPRRNARGQRWDPRRGGPWRTPGARAPRGSESGVPSTRHRAPRRERARRLPSA